SPAPTGCSTASGGQKTPRAGSNVPEHQGPHRYYTPVSEIPMRSATAMTVAVLAAVTGALPAADRKPNVVFILPDRGYQTDGGRRKAARNPRNPVIMGLEQSAADSWEFMGIAGN